MILKFINNLHRHNIGILNKRTYVLQITIIILNSLKKKKKMSNKTCSE